MGLGRVLSFYLRLDSGTCFLDPAALEVTDTMETTGSVPPSDEDKTRQRRKGEMRKHPDLVAGHFSWKFHL